MKRNLSASVFNKIAFPFFCLLALSFTLNLNAQTTYSTKPATAEVKVKGSSNIHDWSMKGNTITLDANWTVQSATAPKLTSLNGMNFSIPVKTLKSGENLLDSRAYKAMEADKHPTVTFKLTSATVTQQKDNQYVIKAIGNMTIAGVTKETTLWANATLNADRSLNIAGNKKFKMSEFGIKPPSYMLGAMKVYDELTIEYTLKLNAN